ncbi:MAG TPA: tetratricopeptide repeat protein [Geobacteraceae bacterium]|nr:tetratricopeptide repeat protein [Geobacteraceae bacterium]
MKKENIIIAAMAIVILLLGGFLIFSLSGKKEAPQTEKVPAGSGSPAEYQQRIAELEKIVANDPKNLQAWSMLANDYYDTDQPQKAIDAYSRAIELDPNNPNLYTDQGVMYKRISAFDKALANFEKAQKIDPKHLQSLYNMGIIYAEDLKKPEMAIKIWTRYLELDSTSPAAQQVKSMITQLKGAPQNPGAK